VRQLYPEGSRVGVWQVSDRLLNACKADVAHTYSTFAVRRLRRPRPGGRRGFVAGWAGRGVVA
jgi:hypothetical protein